MLSTWFKDNNLHINVNKTITVRFIAPTANLQDSVLVRLDGKIIEQASSAKLSGVTLDQTLNWEAHLNFITKSIASFCYALKRLHILTNIETCMAFYYRQFLPKATHGRICWCCSTPA